MTSNDNEAEQRKYIIWLSIQKLFHLIFFNFNFVKSHITKTFFFVHTEWYATAGKIFDDRYKITQQMVTIRDENMLWCVEINLSYSARGNF